MHDESSHDPTRAYDETERDVLYLMTEPDRPEPIWSVEDLARAMEKPDIIDYVRGLHRAGLVHKTSDGFVFASRAAVRMVQMVDQAV
jgi:hypothetical protein